MFLKIIGELRNSAYLDESPIRVLGTSDWMIRMIQRKSKYSI